MKTIIIYNSQTGFTKRYAKWISEELQCPYISYNEGRKLELESYECIIYGAWAMGGNFVKMDWFLDFAKNHPEICCIGYGVGASPAELKEIQDTIAKLFNENTIPGFYFPGGLDYTNMKFSYKTMLKMFAKMIKKKKDKTKEEEAMAEMISKNYDISDKKFVIPLVDYVKEL